MNKPAVVLLGIVVAIGAISAGGAWYTGKQLEPVLQTAISNANHELQTSLTGVDGHVTLELVSLERHLFSSTAHYRVKAEGRVAGESDHTVELLFVDNIEHGPLPFSRLVSLKWLPVMATSHFALEKSPDTEKWFALSKDVSPLKGIANIGYNGSADGNVELLPLETKDEEGSLAFSGANLDFSTNDQARNVKLSGYMDSFKVTTTDANDEPFSAELGGFTVAANLNKSDFGFYNGESTFELTNTKLTLGPQQSVLTLKNAEAKSTQETTGTNTSGRADYKIDEIGYQGKPVGSLAAAFSMKNVDAPSFQALSKIYQEKLAPAQAAVAAGQPAPELQLTEAEQALIQTNINQFLASKPHLNLENLSLKTANGESRFNLTLDLTKPSSLELPPVELGKQIIALLDTNLTLSKPMLKDIASLQAQIQGETDPKTIEQQAQLSSDTIAAVAAGSQLATVEGNDILAKLHYANNEVTFNGQKMTVEQFIGAMLGKLAAVSGAQ